MSKFLSKIKARLEPSQQFTYPEETGWVRAALESMEQEAKLRPEMRVQSTWQSDLLEKMKQVSIGSPDRRAASSSSSVAAGSLSPPSASKRLWETGSLDHTLPDGFYSIIPADASKFRSSKFPAIEEIQNSGDSSSSSSSSSPQWDILLVDGQQDKTLITLKEMCLELVKGLEIITADCIRKIATMVADFYGGPLFETGNVREHDVACEKGGHVRLLGQVKLGLCRPRALLFKYLGDAVGLKNRLLMGLQLDAVPSTSLICSNPRKHLTNVVNLNGKEMLVDVMRYPGHLRPFTVKALVMYHISGPGDSDSAADYDSCDSPLEPNSPLFESGSPSQSEPDLAHLSWCHNRRKSTDERGNISSPEQQYEVRYFQRRHMGDAARSFPTSPEHRQHRLQSFRSRRSQDGSNSSSPEQIGQRARTPSMLSGSRRPVEEDTSLLSSTSRAETSIEHQYLLSGKPSPYLRRRSSSFSVRETGSERAPSSEFRKARKRSSTPEISDEVVRAVRAMNEAMRQSQRDADNEMVENACSSGDNKSVMERISSEPHSLNLCGGSSSAGSSMSSRCTATSSPQPHHLMSTSSSTWPDDIFSQRTPMPYAEWNIEFSELRIGIRVGIGSFGEVFRGTWRGTEVAVKVMLEQHLTRENTEDFFNEISILSRLRHPNVILFMGACTRPPRLSLVTEYMHMGSLYRLIHSNGQGRKLSWRRRLKMLRDICRGMMCIERMNIIHRDLKSANCLVDKHWCVKICDFGLSRFTDGTPIQDPTAAGTPEWMAPELLRNEAVTNKCDVFSLGVIMWELCTLKRPWESVQPLQVVYEVSHNRSRLEIPQGILGKLISDCWEEVAELRPSYDEILSRLHECDFLLG